MLRRTVTFLSILGYLAGQLSAAPHSHSGQAHDSRHADRPHIHVSWSEHGHAHHHPHEHETVPHKHDQPANADGLAQFETSTTDHDSDAYYLPASQVATQPQVAPGDFAQSHYLAVAYLPCSPTPSQSLDISFAALKHSQNASVWHCAPFLELGVLRI